MRKFFVILLLYVLNIWHRAKDLEQNYWYLTFVRCVHLTQNKISWAKLLISYYNTSCTFDTEKTIVSKITDILLFYVLCIWDRTKGHEKVLISFFCTSCSFDTEQKIISKISDILLLKVLYICHNVKDIEQN